jgi:hypothetical protein
MLKWSGTVTSIIGSFMVAFGIMFWGYCLFIMGSASWLYIGVKTKDKPLITLNLVFLSANIVGFVRNF